MAVGSFHDQQASPRGESGHDAFPRKLSRRAALAGSLGGLTLRPFLNAQTASRSLVEGLRARLTGRLIVPDDPAYEQARRPISFNPTTDHHPQMIVKCATHEDVAWAVVFAREHALEVAIRSGATTCSGLACATEWSSICLP